MFFIQLLIGAALICLTVIIHAICLDTLIRWVWDVSNTARLMFKRHWKVPLLAASVLGVFCAHIIQIWIWAIFYLYVEALPDLESALYFSTSTFTTVGFGDVVLTEKWRLVSSFQSANGFILFGWSTAFIFELMSRLYEHDSGD